MRAPRSPSITPPGIGTPAPSPSDPPLTTAQTQPVAAGANVYTSMQGDEWDMIAMRVYGIRRGNEHLMYRLLEENYPLRYLSIFPAGVLVVVPSIDVATEIPLVPWKVTTIEPSQ
jgi:phage tail protein X